MFDVLLFFVSCFFFCGCLDSSPWKWARDKNPHIENLGFAKASDCRSESDLWLYSAEKRILSYDVTNTKLRDALDLDSPVPRCAHVLAVQVACLARDYKRKSQQATEAERLEVAKHVPMLYTKLQELTNDDELKVTQKKKIIPKKKTTVNKMFLII